jgi:pilus assembly protein CpaC
MHALRTWKLWKRRLLGAGVVAAGLCLAPTVWGQAPGGLPVGGGPGGGITSPALERTDVTLTIGESYLLRTSQIIKEAILSKSGVVSITPGEKDPNTLVIKAIERGAVQLSIILQDNTREDRTILVTPDVEYINRAVKRLFPTSNVTVLEGSPGSLIASGWVESSEDVEPILRFLEAFTLQLTASGAQQTQQFQQSTRPGYGNSRVTNAIRVAGVQQVQLEVTVASVNRTEARQLDFSFWHFDAQNSIVSAFGTPLSLAEGSLRPASLLFNPTPTGNQIQFALTDASSGFVGFIRALHAENLAKISANPTLVTMSGRPATFLAGGEINQVVSGGVAGGVGGGGGSGIQGREFGTRVTFLPVVLGNGRIRLQVFTEVSRPVGQAVTQPTFSVQNFEVSSVQSTVEMESGQSFIIGGLIQNVVESRTEKLPVLGDLPYLGALFRNTNAREEERELLVVVTVRLVDAMDSAQKCLVKLPGSETRSPTDFELYLEGILEAPRGPRAIFENRTYVPAHKHAEIFGSPAGHCEPACKPAGGLGGLGLLQHNGCAHGGTFLNGVPCTTGCGSATLPATQPVVPTQNTVRVVPTEPTTTETVIPVAVPKDAVPTGTDVNPATDVRTAPPVANEVPSILPPSAPPVRPEPGRE